MENETGRKLDPEIVKFLGNGKNMDQAPLADASLRNTPKVEPVEPVIEAETVEEYFGKGHNKRQMPFAPKDSLDGARR